jgi:uncharacterized protein YecE (DUF72 family)
MINWRLGTVGFGYDDWSGVFYPPALKSSHRLAYYARHFNSVEIDTTFHAAPDAGRIRRWAAAVPDTFRFCVKTPRAVTHDLSLQEAARPMLDFLKSLREFGDKLAVVLLQFPPSFSADRMSELDHFLSQMPRHVRFAVELRSRTWDVPRTLELLQEQRCCLVAAEYQYRPTLLPVTTDFLYVRWIGQHGAFTHFEREQVDMSDSLKWWRSAIEQTTPRLPAPFDSAQDVPATVYGFANNDYAGYAIGTCNRFKEIAGLAISQSQGDPQGRLF